MTVPQQYISVTQNLAHIEKHFAQFTAVGSKFFPEKQDEVISRIDAELASKFDEASQSGPVGRIVLEIEFDEEVGTDALFHLDDHLELARLNVIHDKDTAHEKKVTVAQTEDIPSTKIVTVIAGPYYTPGQWGSYTLFPGKEAPPFPHPDQPAERLQHNRAFWANNGFLATAAEIKAQAHVEQSPTQQAQEKLDGILKRDDQPEKCLEELTGLFEYMKEHQVSLYDLTDKKLYEKENSSTPHFMDSIFRDDSFASRFSRLCQTTTGFLTPAGEVEYYDYMGDGDNNHVLDAIDASVKNWNDKIDAHQKFIMEMEMEENAPSVIPFRGPAPG